MGIQFLKLIENTKYNIIYYISAYNHKVNARNQSINSNHTILYKFDKVVSPQHTFLLTYSKIRHNQ